MAKKNDYVSLFRRNEHQLISDKMQKAADAKGLDTDIFAVSASEADQHLESKDVNVLLLGPSSSFHERRF